MRIGRPTSTPRRIGRVSAAIGTIAVLVGVAGCSGSPQGATTLDTDADVTITMWSGQTDDAQKILESLATEFEKDHPNVTIDLSPGASSTEDLLQKL
ncbi:MAG: ABC transporter substrate-binding protein, partial [Mycetocola sp.]